MSINIYTHTPMCAYGHGNLHGELFMAAVPYPIKYLGPVRSSACLLYTRYITKLPPDK